MFVENTSVYGLKRQTFFIHYKMFSQNNLLSIHVFYIHIGWDATYLSGKLNSFDFTKYWVSSQYYYCIKIRLERKWLFS